MAGAVIRANRAEVSDRFPMLGFTVRTGARPYFEAVITTDAALFDPSQHQRRGPGTFWSSRVLGPLPAERGEAVFVVPDAVLRRFAGAQRLYYSVATFADRARSNPEVTLPAPNAPPFVTLWPAYTGKRLRQLVGGGGEGARWSNNGSGYDVNSKDSLEWAGDSARTGIEAPAAGEPGATSGGSNGGGATAASLGYDDGYGNSLWKEKSRRGASAGMAPGARGLSEGAFDIGWGGVPMVPMAPDVPSWLAATAMLIAWRDRAPADSIQVLSQIGSNGPTSPNGRIEADEIAAIAHALGLVPEAPTPLTVEGLRGLVTSSGPQWLGVAGLAPRAVVVTGLHGDGTPQGTQVLFNDPSPQPLAATGVTAADRSGMESSYILTFQQFVDAFAAIAPGAGLQAIHVTEADMQGRAPLLTAQANALTHNGSRGRSNGRRTTSQAQAAPVVAAIVSTIAGAGMTRVANNEGDVSWELDQLQGVKHPGDDAARTGTANFRTIVTPVKGWPVVESGLSDQIYADFEIEWQCNGHSVGNVTIKNVHANDAVGWGLKVQSTINDDNIVYQGDQAGLRVTFNYRFSRTIGSDAIAIRDFTLYADGTFHEDSRWTQEPDGWFGATEQGVSRAYGGGAVVGAIVGEAVAPVIQWVKESLTDDIETELPTVDGWVHLDGDPSNRRPSQEQVQTAAIKGPQMGIDYLVTESTIRCDLLATWRYDGSSVGYVRIRPTNPNDPPGGGLRIKGEVYTDEPAHTNSAGERAAAIRLLFTYTFTFSADSLEYRNFDLILYGDGTYDVVRHD